jgi:DNA invertase Pin-like site-specific DNA recombinase
MTTAAIYARFSTDRQDATSIADQIRVCRARAKAIGLDILGEYSDAAVSGAIAVLDRPGAGAMHAAALAGKFDVLLVESLDRLSRDSVDSEAVLRRLEHRGLRIIGVADSYDTASGESRRIVRGVRGLINEFYRSDLPHKIRCGLEGQVERGFHAGGMSYGYRSVPVGMNARGEAEGFRLEIEPQHAEVVRWIYARYAEGWSCQRIAADLNRRSVRGPGRRRLDRPSTWSVAALYGTPTAGSGILNNELYVGRYIWNRREWVRDPDKPKKRVPRIRPQEQWRVKERPELRIVDDALWKAVRGRMTRKNGDSGHLKRGPGPRTLFGGLLRCGRCGGAVIAVSGREYGCAARKDRGAAVCTGVRAPRKETDRRLVGVLREEVLSPHAIAQIRDQVRRILSESQQQAMEIRRSANPGFGGRDQAPDRRCGRAGAFEGPQSTTDERGSRVRELNRTCGIETAAASKYRGDRREDSRGRDATRHCARTRRNRGARDPRRQAGTRRDRGTRWRGMGADASRPRTAVRSRGRLRIYSGLRGPAIRPVC